MLYLSFVYFNLFVCGLNVALPPHLNKIENQLDLISNFILLVITPMLLMSPDPPYSTSIQVFVFVLVFTFTIFMIGFIFYSRLNQKSVKKFILRILYKDPPINDSGSGLGSSSSGEHKIELESDKSIEMTSS